MVSISPLNLKREFKQLCTAQVKPSLLDVPPLWFLMLDGMGDPNCAQFSDGVSTL